MSELHVETQNQREREVKVCKEEGFVTLSKACQRRVVSQQIEGLKPQCDLRQVKSTQRQDNRDRQCGAHTRLSANLC